MNTVPPTVRRLLLAVGCGIVVGALAGCADTPTTPKYPLQKGAGETCVVIDGQVLCTG